MYVPLKNDGLHFIVCSLDICGVDGEHSAFAIFGEMFVEVGYDSWFSAYSFEVGFDCLCDLDISKDLNRRFHSDSISLCHYNSVQFWIYIIMFTSVG